MTAAFEQAYTQARACRLCEADLPLGPGPIVRLHATTRLLVISQAPGTKAHESGLTFDDASGDRLRDWMGIDRDIFYGNRYLGFMPMGFCYPGRDERGGDLPPLRLCAATWHPRLRPLLPSVGLTLLVGQYAHAYYLGARRRESLTETVRAWRDYMPEFLPLPHPSWRNTGWLKQNPWFARAVVPALRRQVRRLLELKR